MVRMSLTCTISTDQELASLGFGALGTHMSLSRQERRARMTQDVEYVCAHMALAPHGVHALD